MSSKLVSESKEERKVEIKKEGKEIKDYINKKSTYTLTFGDQAENHHGMQKIGIILDKGISFSKLNRINKSLLELDCKTELIDLTPNFNLRESLEESKEGIDSLEIKAENASILIIRNGVSKILGEDGLKALYEETVSQEVDKKAYMRGRVVNKLARWNVCYGDVSQEPDYENKKGTIVNFNNVPMLKK